MPKLTAPQLLWTGVAVLVVGVVGSWVSQVLLVRWWSYTLFYSAGTMVSGSLVTVGAALIAGAFVVAALQRGAAVAPGPVPLPPAPYGPAPTPGTTAPDPQPGPASATDR